MADLRLSVERETQNGFAAVWQSIADLRVSIRQELAATHRTVSQAIRMTAVFQ